MEKMRQSEEVDKESEQKRTQGGRGEKYKKKYEKESENRKRRIVKRGRE